MKGNSRHSGYVRADNDWYAEPRHAIDALLDVETFWGMIWDPACGSGNIPDACKARELDAVGSDIISRTPDYPMTSDFLTTPPLHATSIISNPPYLLAEMFALHALSIAQNKVALLTRTMFLEGQGRHARLFKPYPFARMWQFSSRISMPPGGTDVPARNGSIAYMWLVWDPEHRGAPTVGWLP